jgi:hypothetical protein
MTPAGPPQAPPGGDPELSPPRGCPATKKNGKPCGAPLKPHESACYNHDPARDAERRSHGALRQGDPGTELGGYPGIARRAAQVLADLEAGDLEPIQANAQRGLLRFLAELVGRRDKSEQLARTLRDLEMATPGEAPAAEAPRRLEDLV